VVDPTGGLADGSSDVALVWLPVPELDEAYSCQVLTTEPRHVALPLGHRLAALDVVPFADLLDEPFLALPETAGPLRGYWLAEADAAADRLWSRRWSRRRTRRSRRSRTASAWRCSAQATRLCTPAPT
jgi:DNA-binding transcriptional LysR family regulator